MGSGMAEALVTVVLWVSLNSVHLDSQQTKELHITLTATSLPPLSAIGIHTLSDFDRVPNIHERMKTQPGRVPRHTEQGPEHGERGSAISL